MGAKCPAGAKLRGKMNAALVPRDEQVTEYVYFTFTDARGTPWSRFGSQQPVQQIPKVE